MTEQTDHYIDNDYADALQALGREINDYGSEGQEFLLDAIDRAIALLRLYAKEAHRQKYGPWTQAENNAFNHLL